MKKNARGSWPLWLAATGLAGLALGLTLLPAQSVTARQPYTSWIDYGGSPDSMQYSALKQIDKSNVGKLELAWSYRAPDLRGNFGFNPVVVDGVMYVLGQSNAIVALDAATGKQIWAHRVEGRPANRGINYWESEDRSDRRLLFGASGHLHAINATTGIPIPSFGDDGRVNLRVGEPRPLGGPSGTPGRIFENLILIGSNTGEGYGSAPGDLRAFDVRTGELVWTFHTIPRPGEFGYDTWPPDAWTYVGGVNTWGEISVDEKRGIAYFPLGSPTFDLYGGDRHGDNLFGNSLLALDARTGKRLWHFQTVHHDLWDYDLVTAPKLLTVRHNGEMVDIVAQATKFGLLYVFNRVTGEPLWPIEERPVPQSDVPGEQSSPTQPFPTKPPPFARLKFGVEDLNPYVDPEEKKVLRGILLNALNEGVFTPSSHTRNTITVPGELGASNWGGSAGDPETGMLYVRTADQPAMHILREWRPQGSRRGSPAERGLASYSLNCEICHGTPEANGIRSMDRSSVIPVKELGAERIQAAVREGFGQMPAFPTATLSNGELETLIDFLLGKAAVSDHVEEEPRRPGRVQPELPPMPDGLTRYTGRLGAMWRTNSGLSAMGPPWGQIVAYDLNEGTIKWKAPLGTVPALVALGIKNTGNAHRLHRNGPAVTAGGLIFVGTWSDRTLRAYDKDDGSILWEYQIEANPEGLASVFEVDGRQYVAFCASGSAEDSDEPDDNQSIAFVPGKASAQGYYVFALPRAGASGAGN